MFKKLIIKLINDTIIPAGRVCYNTDTIQKIGEYEKEVR